MARYLKTVFLLVALTLAACAAGPTRDQTLSEHGVNAMHAGNLPEAEQLLTQAVQVNPNNMQALYNLGVLYQQTNRPGLAREYYQRVIDGQPDAKKNGQDPEQAAKLAQSARDNIAQMDREEAIREEAMKRAEAEQAAKEAAAAQPALVQPPPAPVVEESGYRVQTGAFVIATNAESMRDMLLRRHANLIMGKQVRLVKVSGMTKVQVGSYRTIDDADSACRALKRAGVNCFRVKYAK